MDQDNRHPTPNLADTNKHLFTLYAPKFVQAYSNAWIEVATSNPLVGGINAARKFSAFDLAGAAKFAVEQNGKRLNVYVGVALRQGYTGPSNRASERNYLATQFAWADADRDLDRINGILEASGLSTSMVVVTGRTPQERGHLYFRLDGSVTAAQLKAVNNALMTRLGTDDVCSPCNLMRLAGTVNWPTAAKRAKGYVPETVTLHVRAIGPHYSVERLTGSAPQAEEGPRRTVGVVGGGGGEPVERVRFALDVISSDCPRMDWLRVAAALRSEFGEDGFNLFNWWSAKAAGCRARGDGSPMYTPEKTARNWREARCMNAVSIATVFRAADQADRGWRARYEATLPSFDFSEMIANGLAKMGRPR